MKQITIGVAGHIDHGKTALVRALTGQETDRLAEEQARGMSIVLGFAHLGLPEGEIDLVDVPGHEKFVHTMIAGATGIDAVLLVIGANERIQPQTEEHIALTQLLGVRKGIVVITKSDLVPSEQDRARVQAEIAAGLQSTFLGHAPIVWASAVTGDGLETVRRGLRDLLLETAPQPELSFFCLPIDRAFSITGYGTVVTGTLRRGGLHVGQSVQIWPQGTRAEVRGLEVHGLPVKHAQPGRRVAVNLRGIKKEDVARGDLLATPDTLVPARYLDAHLTVLPSAPRPVKNGQTVRLHWGTSDTEARAHLLDADEIAPGEEGFVQWRLAHPVVAPPQEPFVVRAVSPAETLGGGTLLDTNPARHRRFDPDTLARLAVLRHGTLPQRADAKLREAGAGGADARHLAVALGVPLAALEAALADAVPVVLCSGGLMLHRDTFEALQAEILRSVHAFHDAHPTLPGLPLAELRASLPPALKPPALARVLEDLVRQSRVHWQDGLVRDAKWTAGAGLDPHDRLLVQELETLFRDGGLQPPRPEDVVGLDKKRRSLFQYLIQQKVIVEAVDKTNNRTIFFHRDALAEARHRLETGLARGAALSVSQLNTVLGTTRKFSIPLLEHFDRQGVIRREGDLRVWNDIPIKHGRGVMTRMADKQLRLTEMVSGGG